MHIGLDNGHQVQKMTSKRGPGLRYHSVQIYNLGTVHAQDSSYTWPQQEWHFEFRSQRGNIVLVNHLLSVLRQGVGSPVWTEWFMVFGLCVRLVCGLCWCVIVFSIMKNKEKEKQKSVQKMTDTKTTSELVSRREVGALHNIAPRE